MIWDKGQEEGAGDTEGVDGGMAWDCEKDVAVPEGRVLTASLVFVPLPSATTPSESLYQLLSQTSPENMHRNVAQYGLDPATRYPNLNLRAVTPNQVRLSILPSHPSSQTNSFPHARPSLLSCCPRARACARACQSHHSQAPPLGLKGQMVICLGTEEKAALGAGPV